MSSTSPDLNVNTSDKADINDPPEVRTHPRPRRPYQKPGFIVSQAFERQALSCAGCLNQSAAFPNFCAMRS